MTQRIVLDTSLLRLRAALIVWGEEPGPGDTSGTAPVNLRWMIHPSIGLPLQSFQVWRMQAPAGTPDKQDLANSGDWELVEIVGLPVDEKQGWSGVGYPLDPQGLVDDGLGAPRDAAFNRLMRGAPRRGWLSPVDKDIPAWERPDEGQFLESLMRGRLMAGLRSMLVNRPQPLLQAQYMEDMGDAAEDLVPKLVLNKALGTLSGDDNPRGSWAPLSLMAIAAGTDPLAALGLGFGTAVEPKLFGEEIYMVTVNHVIDPDSGLEIELADIAFPHLLKDRVPPPLGLATRLAQVTRPQVVDGPTLETISIGWQRPIDQGPPAPFAPETPIPVSYGVAWINQGQILLTRRADDDPDSGIAGWLSYVPGRSDDDGPMTFLHHRLNSLVYGDGAPHPGPLEFDATYGVAAQDLFGRWSDWAEVPFVRKQEGPQGPTIVSVTLDEAGKLTVDFSWDWSDRSPEFIALQGAWSDAAAAVVASARVDFAGKAAGDTHSAYIVPLAADRTPCDWGAAQDKDVFSGAPAFYWSGDVSTEPGTRYYRWMTTIELAFNGAPWREFGVSGCGQQWIHYIYFQGTPWNTSPLTPPVTTRVWDNQPLPSPTVELDVPCWASLPDPLGVSRYILRWNAAPAAMGYIVYEATEAALRDVSSPDTVPQPPPVPDTAIPYHVRLESLRSDVHIPAKRSVFRRVNTAPITETSYEVTLPRGSKVMHFFAVTSVTANNVEGSFPTDNRSFFAVAAPRLAVPPLVALAGAPAADNPQAVALQIELLGGENGAVEIYRTTNEVAAADVGSMGLPLITINVAGSATFTDATASPGWRPQRYRAVALGARDDVLGLVETRSPPTPQAVVLLAPTAPSIENLQVNIPASPTAPTYPVTWKARSLAPPVPARVLAIVEVRTADPDQTLLQRFAGTLQDETAPDGIPTSPMADATPVRIFVSAGGICRTWIKRPLVEQPITVSVKVIDPFGRIARATVEAQPVGPGAHS
jgi:hypothetical protein